MQKYITVNGVMKKNPLYVAEGTTSTVTEQPYVPITYAPMAVVSSLDDLMAASEIQETESGVSIPATQSVTETVAMLQDSEILEKFQSRTPVQGGELLDKLGDVFAKYEIPLGMINKLMMLTEYKLDFIVDDSYSMTSRTDVHALDVTECMKTVIHTRLNRAPNANDKMTRIEEAEDRLHTMLDILAYIPIEHIQLRFLNNTAPLVLNRTGKTPGEFQAYAHAAVRERFSRLRYGSTPVAEVLTTGFDYPGQWSHYLFNDGVPDEGGLKIAQQIIARKHPEKHPLTLISCTDKDEETVWMKLVDSQAKNVAEIDDFSDEREEVQKKQGSAFPYTRGLWLISHLVASINPDDLDALDENLPFTKCTLDNILGRKLSPVEYQYYFEHNPNAGLYVKNYLSFLTEECFARNIIPTEKQERLESAAGYVNGNRPLGTLANIGSELQPITARAQQKFDAQYKVTNEEKALTSPSSTAPHSSFMPPVYGLSLSETPSPHLNSAPK